MEEQSFLGEPMREHVHTVLYTSLIRTETVPVKTLANPSNLPSVTSLGTVLKALYQSCVLNVCKGFSYAAPSWPGFQRALPRPGTLAPSSPSCCQEQRGLRSPPADCFLAVLWALSSPGSQPCEPPVPGPPESTCSHSRSRKLNPSSR